MRSNTIEVEKVENGYVVREPFYLKVEQRVYTNFEDVVKRLKVFFDESS